MDDNYYEINRIGYGSNFNKIFINNDNTKIKKICVSDYGIKKINAEIYFYKYINKYENLSFPKIYQFIKNGYIMQYMNNYEPLYKLYNFLSDNQKNNIILNITNELNKLHNLEKKYISKDEYIDNLNLEINVKIIDRFNSIKNKINMYSFIKYVNNIKIYDFDYILTIINNKIYDIINTKNEYYLTIIHGDCQFNNILFNKYTKDIILIDPRGYFGNNLVFGIPEYDFAKLYFAFSGYDEFDNRDISSLEIEKDNIRININILDNDLFNKNELEILLMLNIWLGNAQCFMENNEIKGIYSYFISIYLGSIYINNKCVKC